jgi:hypothetical protein
MDPCTATCVVAVALSLAKASSLLPHQPRYDDLAEERARHHNRSEPPMEEHKKQTTRNQTSTITLTQQNLLETHIASRRHILTACVCLLPQQHPRLSRFLESHSLLHHWSFATTNFTCPQLACSSSPWKWRLSTQTETFADM